MVRESVYIFWDNSNIFIPAKFIATKRDGLFADQCVRIHFDNLFKLAHGGRKVGSAVCVGSVPPELGQVWDHLKATGVTIELYERGAASGTEQGVDQCLQIHMLRVLADVRPPGIAVLLTGDGAGYDTGAGYHADLERLQKFGWGIEVLSWDAACKKALKEWAKQVGVYIPLDDYYNSVTFIEDGRRAGNLSMVHRGMAHPISEYHKHPSDPK